MKSKSVLVDHDILGWGKENEADLSKTYGRIVKAGTEPGLERRKPDTVLALYCRENDCDLLTGDVRAYQYFFDVGVKAVQISRYTWIAEPTDKAVFLIQIAEKEQPALEFFLSYNTRDKHLAGQVKHALEEKGHSAFLAHEDLQPSVEWVKEIRQRLDNCTALLAIVTPDFAGSDYANQEIGFVIGRGKPMIGMRYLNARLPGFLQSMQAIDVKFDNLASQIGKAIQTVEQRLTETLVRPSSPMSAADFIDSVLDRRRERYWRAIVRPSEPYEFIPASGATDNWLVANCLFIFQYVTTRSIPNGLVFERNDNGQIYAEVRTNGEVGYGVSLSDSEKVHLERAAQVTGSTMQFASKIYQHYPHEQIRRGHVLVELKLARAFRQPIRCNQISSSLERDFITDEAVVIAQRRVLFDQIESDWRGQLGQIMVDLCRHFGLAIETDIARKVGEIVVPVR